SGSNECVNPPWSANEPIRRPTSLIWKLFAAGTQEPPGDSTLPIAPVIPPPPPNAQLPRSTLLPSVTWAADPRTVRTDPGSPSARLGPRGKGLWRRSTAAGGAEPL